MKQESLEAIYQQKMALGTQAMIEGRIVGHPYVTPEYKEQRYAISAVAFRFSGPVAEFLSDVSEKLQSTEPTAHRIPISDLHIDLNVLSIHSANRRAAGITATDLCDQKLALIMAFSEPGDPIRLELRHIAALADRESVPETSVTLTALFMPTNDRLQQVRDAIQQNTAGMFATTSKQLDIVHSSLARLTQPPSPQLMSVLNELNQQLSIIEEKDKILVINNFDLISTTQSKEGFYKADYVMVGQPISLVEKNDPASEIIFRKIRPTL